jgi:hypothetical protein
MRYAGAKKNTPLDGGVFSCSLDAVRFNAPSVQQA